MIDVIKVVLPDRKLPAKESSSWAETLPRMRKRTMHPEIEWNCIFRVCKKLVEGGTADAPGTTLEHVSHLAAD